MNEKQSHSQVTEYIEQDTAAAHPERGKLHVHLNLHPWVSLIITSVVGFILLVSWAFYGIEHPKDFSAATVDIFSIGPLVAKGVAILLVVWLASHVAGHLIERVMHPLIRALHMLFTAIGQLRKNTVLAQTESYAITHHKDGAQFHQVTQERTTYNLRGDIAPKQIAAPDDAPPDLPNFVRYEDVKASIPQGHALVGISERGLETREDSIRALVWVVGGSGVGKTNSVSLRVDDDFERGHRFLGIDPHAFKSDSLTRALHGYMARFLMPIAQKTEDINSVLDAFIGEFERRKNGGTWQYPITLVVDEVGSMVSDIDKEDPLEQDVARKLKTVARICGQESRGFEMVGIFISQDAAGLSWLRKRALMVLAHQVMMMSERLLVCNEDRAIAKQMDTWPKGRTLAYGIAFTEGPIVVQQPIFRPRIVEANIPNLAPNPFTPGRTIVNAVNDVETPSQAAPLRLVNVTESEGLDAQKDINTSSVGNDIRGIILRMHRAKKPMPLGQIAEAVGLNGRKYPLFMAVCSELGIKREREA